MRSMSMAALMLLSTSLAAPALAQTAAPIDTRVTKLEKEMRAVQRKVFPGGDSRYFEPEISAPVTAAPTAPAAPTNLPKTGGADAPLGLLLAGLVLLGAGTLLARRTRRA